MKASEKSIGDPEQLLMAVVHLLSNRLKA